MLAPCVQRTLFRFTSIEMFPPACIHGRFQILHNDHVAYFEAAQAKYGRLYIGLTCQQRDQNSIDRRAAAEANPLSLWERAEMWRALLNSLGQAQDHMIGPFPIESPEFLPDFVPRSCICATTIREAWNQEKVSRLQSAGYEVDILPHDSASHLASRDLRRMIAAGDQAWRNLTPRPVADFLEASGIERRLRSKA